MKASTPQSEEEKAKLEARAARFRSTAAPNSSGGGPVGPVSSSPAAGNDKLASRAARFADVQAIPAVATSGKVSTGKGIKTTLSSGDAEKLALRAARFSGVPQDEMSSAKGARK